MRRHYWDYKSKEMTRTEQINTIPEREKRQWWAVHNGDVLEVTGYSCAPNNPDCWWCPKAGYTLTVGHHLFETEKAALKKAILEVEDELKEAQADMRKLTKRLERLEE
jgi:hypothetical protein